MQGESIMNYTVFQWFNNFAGSSKLLDSLMITITNSAAYVQFYLCLSYGLIMERKLMQ